MSNATMNRVQVTVDVATRGRLFVAEAPIGCAPALIEEACRLAITQAAGSRPMPVTVAVSPARSIK